MKGVLADSEWGELKGKLWERCTEYFTMPTMRTKPIRKCKVLKSTSHFKNKVETGFFVYPYSLSQSKLVSGVWKEEGRH